MDNAATTTPQGFGDSRSERLPVLEQSAMNDAQRAAADALLRGPRKAILGPFIPLLRAPVLMERIGKAGEALRFESTLPDCVRELVICVVARETGNQFEWQMHAPLAIQAGIPATAIDALAAGRRPRGLDPEPACAFDFVHELMARHGVSDETYAETASHFGEAQIVELTALVGYFAMVCWIMNVARTPGVYASKVPALRPFPR